MPIPPAVAHSSTNVTCDTRREDDAIGWCAVDVLGARFSDKRGE